MCSRWPCRPCHDYYKRDHQPQDGTPASFLDVGGGPNEKQVQTEFEILFDAI
jgi:hypothetical protein